MKFFFLSLLFFCCCASPSPQVQTTPATFDHASVPKINGVGFAAPSQSMPAEAFKELNSINANYVCLLPFAFMKSNEPKIYFNSQHQWWGERPEGVAACIRYAHNTGLKVMLKPQIWMHDYFTGDINFKSEEDWKVLERDYTAFIFAFVQVADTTNAEMFCIGTELDSFVMLRPQYWSHLIDTIRSVYHGQLTYAENWDCYHEFPFWSKLDYIGINAYFPLSDESTPTHESLVKAWKKVCAPMHELSEKTGKPVLFTEFGYRSIDCCAKQPWDAYTNSIKNYQAQQNAYEALFKECWSQPWFAGGFCWKWFDKNSGPDVSVETDYTPQGKPAEQVLKNWYSQR